MITIAAILLTSFFKYTEYETVRYSLVSLIFNAIALGAFNHTDREPDRIYICRLSVRCPIWLQLFLFSRFSFCKTPVFLIVSASVLQIYSALRLLCIPFPKEFSVFNGGGYSIAVTAVCAACVLVCLLYAHIVKKKNSDFCANEKSYVQIGSGALSGERPGKAERREKRITAAVGVLLILCAAGVITAMFVKKGIYIDYGENKFILTKYYDTPKEAFTEYISDAWRITGSAVERTDEWQTVKID